MNGGRVIVFLKAPRPGQVKTRLAADLDGEAAAGIYRMLVGRTLGRVEGLGDVELRYTPDDAEAEVEVEGWRRQAGWRLRPQGAGDLGERLGRALAEAFGEGAGRVVVVGTDCPWLEASDVGDAFAALGRSDVVMGPAEDGGYWLLGMDRARPELLRGIPWSTPGVYEATLQRAREAGLRVAELRRLRDVDTLEDWRAWLRDHPM